MEHYELKRAEEWADHAEYWNSQIKERQDQGKGVAAAVDEMFRAIAMSNMWSNLSAAKTSKTPTVTVPTN